MRSLRAHPFLLLMVLAGLALLAIAAAASERSLAPPAGTVIAVSAGTIPPSPPLSSNPQTAPSVFAPDASPPLAPSAPPFAPSPGNVSSEVPAPQGVEGEGDNFPVVRSSALPSATSNGGALPGDDLLRLVYSLPTLGGSPPAAHAGAAPSPGQQALHDWGNEAGLAFISFENAHPDMGQALQDWVNHRSDLAYQSQVNSIADDMDAAGRAIEALPRIPAAAAAENGALGRSLETAAEKLKAVVMAGSSDSALVDAMKTYDAAADQFTKDYLAVLDLLALHQVTFSQSEPGSIFQTPAGGTR